MFRASEQLSVEWNRPYHRCWHRGFLILSISQWVTCLRNTRGDVPFHKPKNIWWKLLFSSHNVNQWHFDSWEIKGRLPSHLESEMLKKGIIKSLLIVGREKGRQWTDCLWKTKLRLDMEKNTFTFKRQMFSWTEKRYSLPINVYYQH